MPKAAIIMGSASDFDIVKKAVDVFREFGIEVSVNICSAHRTPDMAAEFAKNARSSGVDVILAAAGKAAHLPGIIAAHTVLPVIGIPVKSSFMDGLDSLLSIVQMPSGVPVATVGVNASENAALLAVQIIAGKYSELWDKLLQYRLDMQQKVIQSNDAIQGEF